MENPNLSQLATAPPSLTSILKKISENKAYVLFKNLATSNNNGRFIPPLKEMNLSTKQYYSRLSGLLEAGLIKRHKGTYSLTLLGKVVALPRCCTAETGVTVSTPTIPAIPNAATIAIARTNIFEFLIMSYEICNINP